ncbi:MAG: HAD-IIA family hydrolase [Victivallaceae bacterium]|nr:HAD-IIA family hydrolase [Victivallaceae bacterium]
MNRLQQVQHVCLDMDGTIYKGARLYSWTKPFLAFLREHGIAYTFLSNNSSFSRSDYVEKLRKMSVETVEEDFYVSTDYTIDYLHKNHPEVRRLWIMSVPTILPEFERAGFEVVTEKPDAVVIAFDKTLTYEKLCRTAYFMREGVPAFATHKDVFCPAEPGTWLPDCGAMTRCLESATGAAVKVLGKPDPGMLVAASQRKHIAIENTLMVGDRLSTDVALGVNAGALSCHIEDFSSELTVDRSIVPTYRVKNLGELHRMMQDAFCKA